MTVDQRPSYPESSGDKEVLKRQKALFAVVADSVEDTGLVNYMFMFKTEMSNDDLAGVMRKIPGSKFAWLKTITDPDDSRDAHLYVFEGGIGQVASIPIQNEGDFGWDFAVERMPECILLTDQQSFKKLSEACSKVDVDLQSHHSPGVLQTFYKS